MTDINNTQINDVSKKLSTSISNFEVYIDAHYIEVANKQDAERLNSLMALYGEKMLDELEKSLNEVEVLEKFYDENFWEYERNRKIDKPRLFELRDSGAAVEDIIKTLNIGRSTYYKIVKESKSI